MVPIRTMSSSAAHPFGPSDVADRRVAYLNRRQNHRPLNPGKSPYRRSSARYLRGRFRQLPSIQPVLSESHRVIQRCFEASIDSTSSLRGTIPQQVVSCTQNSGRLVRRWHLAAISEREWSDFGAGCARAEATSAHPPPS